MKLTGVEVPFKATLQLQPDAKLQPNTVMVLISDDNGNVRQVEVDLNSIATNESFLKVAGGCFVRIGGQLVWQNPCPY